MAGSSGGDVEMEGEAGRLHLQWCKCKDGDGRNGYIVECLAL